MTAVAKNKTKRVDSKQSTGRKRQSELLASSKCKHDRPAIRTLLLPEGKYVHECWECILTPKSVREVIEMDGGITGAKLMALLLG